MGWTWKLSSSTQIKVLRHVDYDFTHHALHSCSINRLVGLEALGQAFAC